MALTLDHDRTLARQHRGKVRRDSSKDLLRKILGGTDCSLQNLAPRASRRAAILTMVWLS